VIPAGATTLQAGVSWNTVANGFHGQVGVAKSFSVMPGDQLQIQAYAKFGTPSGTASNVGALATELLTAFSLPVPVAGETGTASSGLNVWGGVEAGGYEDDGGAPVRAFVSIVLFDRDHNFLDVAYAPAGTSGSIVSKSYTVKEPGYAYLYVSNEHATQVDV
jgi:hypothetical protein